MFYHVQSLINEIVKDEPDPSAANALQEGLGGQFGEMRTMMQYLFQSFNFRGNARPYLDLIQGVGIEEISHVELISKTIAQLLDGAPEYTVKSLMLQAKAEKLLWIWPRNNRTLTISS
ncbi:MAG TPA: manganese catalase family protein [Chryseosolibacter sp.]